MPADPRSKLQLVYDQSSQSPAGISPSGHGIAEAESLFLGFPGKTPAARQTNSFGPGRETPAKRRDTTRNVLSGPFMFKFPDQALANSGLKTSGHAGPTPTINSALGSILSRLLRVTADESLAAESMPFLVQFIHDSVVSRGACQSWPSVQTGRAHALLRLSSIRRLIDTVAREMVYLLCDR